MGLKENLEATAVEKAKEVANAGVGAITNGSPGSGAGSQSGPGSRNDPFPVYCFRVKLDAAPSLKNGAEMFFRSVSGLKYEVEMTDFQEGGRNQAPHRIIGVTKWSNLVFKRGFSRSFDLVKCVEQWALGETPMVRLTGSIYQLTTRLKPVCQWSFIEGVACKWELSEFDASKSELSVETLEIAHEGLRFKETPQ